MIYQRNSNLVISGKCGQDYKISKSIQGGFKKYEKTGKNIFSTQPIDSLVLSNDVLEWSLAEEEALQKEFKLNFFFEVINKILSIQEETFDFTLRQKIEILCVDIKKSNVI